MNYPTQCSTDFFVEIKRNVHGFSTPANDFYLCSVLIKHMCKVMKYSLYKADAEEENEDSPKLDEKPGGGSTNEYTAT